MGEFNIGDKFIISNNVIGTLVGFDIYGPFLSLEGNDIRNYYRNENGYFRFSLEFLKKRKIISFKFLT